MEPKPTVELHHFRHPTDEQLQHSYIFSNYYNLQSVHFEYSLTIICIDLIKHSWLKEHAIKHEVKTCYDVDDNYPSYSFDAVIITRVIFPSFNFFLCALSVLNYKKKNGPTHFQRKRWLNFTAIQFATVTKMDLHIGYTIIVAFAN